MPHSTLSGTADPNVLKEGEREREKKVQPPYTKTIGHILQMYQRQTGEIKFWVILFIIIILFLVQSEQIQDASAVGPQHGLGGLSFYSVLCYLRGMPLTILDANASGRCRNAHVDDSMLVVLIRATPGDIKRDNCPSRVTCGRRHSFSGSCQLRLSLFGLDCTYSYRLPKASISVCESRSGVVRVGVEKVTESVGRSWGANCN
jgi:hypothetical protein